MKKLKKLTLAIGALGTTVAPIATVISCGNSDDIKKFDLLPTYTAQADQLIALGIKPDYYPLQLDASNPFVYITNPASLMEVQSEDFKNRFSAKIKSLTPSPKGTSWWNQQALDDGERGSDPEYWQHMGGTLVMYEHYLLDDGEKKISESIAPNHYATKRNYLETNFRVSRDPYTRMPKVVMESLLDEDKYKAASSEVQVIVDKLLKVARDIEGLSKDTSNLAGDGNPMPSGKPTREATDDESWLYNDFVFGRQYHIDFMDNTEFQTSQSKNWILNSTKGENWVFDANKENDEALAKLFFASTFQDSEKTIGLAKNAIDNYSFPNQHHPIYEQQEEIGGAPMFEGAQRDNMLYFYNTAARLSGAFQELEEAINDPGTSEYDKGAYEELNKSFPKTSARRINLEAAKTNADLISKQLRTRMANIKKIVDKANNPTYGIATIAPGEGSTTVQSSSKYSFIYNELGFKQPIPTNLTEMTETDEAVEKNIPSNNDAFFNMDDNGWWWNLGDPKSETFNTTEAERTGYFDDQFDLGIMTANTKQFSDMKDAEKANIAKMFKDTEPSQLDDLMVDYNVWNEGLKTPFVLHMILDHIVKQLETKYKAAGEAQEWIDAKNWGSYFTTDFVA